MSVHVRIPTILRNLTGDAAEVTTQGETLREVIEKLETEYPGLQARLLDEQGKVRRFVNLYVGDEDVRFEQGLETPTPEGSQVSIIPAVAGG